MYDYCLDLIGIWSVELMLAARKFVHPVIIIVSKRPKKHLGLYSPLKEQADGFQKPINIHPYHIVVFSYLCSFTDHELLTLCG